MRISQLGISNASGYIRKMQHLSPYGMARFLFPLSLVASSFFLSPARAVVVLSVQQVGTDVFISGSGSANTAGLVSAGSRSEWTNVLTHTQIYAGHSAFEDGTVSLWTGLNGPMVFGFDTNVVENPSPASSGSLFGIVADNFEGSAGAQGLVLPLGYSSGASLSGTSTFTGRTLAQLGLTPGSSYVWNWGSGASADSLRLEVAVPAPLPMAGAAVVFTRLRRLRHLSQRLHA